MTTWTPSTLVDINAKDAVRLLAEQLNEHAGPVVAALHGEGQR